MVAAQVLGTCDFCRVGSSPTWGTKNKYYNLSSISDIYCYGTRIKFCGGSNIMCNIFIVVKFTTPIFRSVYNRCNLFNIKR